MGNAYGAGDRKVFQPKKIEIGGGIVELSDKLCLVILIKEKYVTQAAT